VHEPFQEACRQVDLKRISGFPKINMVHYFQRLGCLRHTSIFCRIKDLAENWKLISDMRKPDAILPAEDSSILNWDDVSGGEVSGGGEDVSDDDRENSTAHVEFLRETAGVVNTNLTDLARRVKRALGDAGAHIEIKDGDVLGNVQAREELVDSIKKARALQNSMCDGLLHLLEQQAPI
jgi:hypothetical protein